MTPISLQCVYLTERICATVEGGAVLEALKQTSYIIMSIRSITATVTIPGAILYACFVHYYAETECRSNWNDYDNLFPI